jgi:hypothetical protein
MELFHEPLSFAIITCAAFLPCFRSPIHKALEFVAAVFTGEVKIIDGLEGSTTHGGVLPGFK